MTQSGSYSTHNGSFSRKPMTAIPIGDALFTKTQQKVLGLLYGKPERSFYTNEIVRSANMGRGTVHRELERMVSAGLLVTSRTGNQQHYQANTECPVYNELLGIVRKSFGIVDLIKTAIKPIDSNIILSFIYGSIAKAQETTGSDIDLFIASNTLEYADVMNILPDSEQMLSRTINPTVYTIRQIRKKLKDKNAFMTRILEQPKLWVKGSEDDIRRIKQSGKHKTAQSRTTRSIWIRWAD